MQSRRLKPAFVLAASAALLAACAALTSPAKIDDYVRIVPKDASWAPYRVTASGIPCESALLVPVGSLGDSTLVIQERVQSEAGNESGGVQGGVLTGREHRYYVDRRVWSECAQPPEFACGYRVTSIWIVDRDYRIYCGSVSRTRGELAPGYADVPVLYETR